MYSGCFSGRQNPLESIFLLLLLRLWGCGQGAERLVHHIHRRLAAVCLDWGSPVQRRVRPLEVVKADPITDQAPGGEAVGDLVEIDRLVFERAPQPLDKDIGSIRELYAFVIDCLERQEVGLWTSGVSRCGFRRREALAVLSGRSEGEASKAAIELGVDEARRCPHCASEGAVSRGMARGLRRYQCKGCGRTFNALTGTPLSGLHHKERWLSFGASLAKGETVKASAARCDVAVSTAFRWRHRFLAAARSDSEVLKGIVEADETYVLESRKGARGLGRKARRRGGKAKKRGLSREQVPVLMAADRSGTTVSAVLPRVDAAALTAALDPVVAKDALLVSDGGASYPPCAAALGASHETLNRSMGERVRGDLHVQTVNSRHSRLKDFLRPRRGIATRYLDNYLSWFHLVGLAPGANDRACLAAAVTR